MTIKQQNLAKLSDQRGIIAALAVDHRGPLQSAIARARGIPEDQVRPEELTEFKRIVARGLGPLSTAVLLDPEYSLPFIDQVKSLTGVLLAYEQSGYDNTRPGRRPALLPLWSVRRLVEAGAQGVKVLLHYTPHESETCNAEKCTLVERVGAECAAAGVPFFLEPLGYSASGETADEALRDKPEVVRQSVEEFGRDRYGVDVLKVEIPIDIRRVEGTRAFAGRALWTRKQALEAFRQAFSRAQKPLIFLSAGVTNEEFSESLELAAESGVNWSGVLCGRSVWQGGVTVYAARGARALEDWALSEGRNQLNAIQRCLERAVPWHQVPSGA